ncbi:MAG: hypothetical protein AMXMBFR84_17610 [Candidatus Hydrogenedentota bacterium]
MNRFVVVTLGLLAVSMAAWAWPGWDWEEGRKKTGMTKPDLQTPQAGLKDLLPLLQATPDSEPIDSVATWEAKRESIITVLESLFGNPENLVRATNTVEEIGREDMGAYNRIHLRIPSEADDAIPAYLLMPKQLPDHPVPAMVVLHQTQAPGKQEACGMTGDPSMAFAKELVERGFICIAPDAVGFGERIREGGQPYDNAMEFYAKHPTWSYFGKMNWDVSRVVDYLVSLPSVDPQRIGIMGHSHGAYGSIMASIFEPRISLVVASCGFTTLRTDPDPNRWSHLTALLPKLGFYMDDVSTAPTDWHEIVACIAPRPYFNWATLEDDIFPETDNLAEVYRQLNGVYSLYGKPEAFTGKLAPGKHRFPEEARIEAYEWIERQFKVEK